jgi:peptide/nickel transport system permease protein
MPTVHTIPEASTAAPAARRLRGWAVGLLEAAGVIIGAVSVAWWLLYALRRDLFPPESSGPGLYGEYVERAFLHFDFGRSFATGRPVAVLMREGLPADAALLAGGIAAGLALGAAGGMLLALRPRTASARLIEVLATVAISTPVFVVGFGVLLLFGDEIGAFNLGLGIPIRYTPFAEDPAGWVTGMLVPWLVLGLPLAGLCVRTTAVGAADVLAQDVVRAARARGIGGRRLATRHVLPVAASPALAIASASASLMLTNMVLVERTFAIPGFMQLVTRSVGQADVPVLLALSVTGATFVVVTTAVLQAVIDRLDPRARR